MTLTRRTFLHHLGGGTVALGVGACGPLSGLARAATRSGALPRSTPEAQGVEAAGLVAFLDAFAHSRHELHSFMLVRHGAVVAEGWGVPYGPHYNHWLYSLSKSFTSTAVGFAVAEGRLTVEDRVVTFFPHDLPAQVSDHLAALQVKHLLTMSVGHATEPVREIVREEDWVRAFLAWPIPHPPGSAFLYNSAGTYMLSALVQKLTGQRVLDYLTPRLFEPLGIEGAAWETCPRGINTGGWGLSVPTEALAKFGQLYLRQGTWKGRALLTPAWVAEATTRHIQQPVPATPNRPNAENDWVQGYGYQFWRCTHAAFRGDGAFGQYAIVLPDHDAVIAMTGESPNMQGELDLVWKHLLPALHDGPLPADRASQRRLRQQWRAWKLAWPGQGAAALPAEATAAGRVSGKTFQLERNALGLDTVSFGFNPSTCQVTFRTTANGYPIACGLRQWQRGETALPGTPPRLVSGGAPKPGTPAKLAAAGAWTDANTFEMLWRYYESPHHDTVTCRFADQTVQVRFLNSLAQMGPNPQDARPVLVGRLVG